jgi:hypothetical protein
VNDDVKTAVERAVEALNKALSLNPYSQEDQLFLAQEAGRHLPTVLAALEAARSENRALGVLLESLRKSVETTNHLKEGT